MPKKLSHQALAILKRAVRDPLSLKPADLAVLKAEDRDTAADAVASGARRLDGMPTRKSTHELQG